VAAIKGFYDYSEGAEPDQTADEAFHEFENQFPSLRRELVSNGFSDWKQHLDFLLRYAQMLRTRSELFRQHMLTHMQHSPPITLERIEQTPDTILLHTKVKPLAENAEEHQVILRNITISQMRFEMAKRRGAPCQFPLVSAIGNGTAPSRYHGWWCFDG
jgi:hypothetical protein